MSKTTNTNKPTTKSSKPEERLAVDGANIKAGLLPLDKLHDSMTNNEAKAPVTDNPGGSCKKSG